MALTDLETSLPYWEVVFSPVAAVEGRFIATSPADQHLPIKAITIQVSAKRPLHVLRNYSEVSLMSSVQEEQLPSLLRGGSSGGDDRFSLSVKSLQAGTSTASITTISMAAGTTITRHDKSSRVNTKAWPLIFIYNFVQPLRRK